MLAAALAGCPRDEQPPAPPATSKAKPKPLAALPYLNWVPVKKQDKGKQGVTRHIPARSFAGLNLFNSRPRHKAQLMTMEGKVVHTWSSSLGQPDEAQQRWSRLWPIFDFAGWHHIKLMPDGGLLAIVYFDRVLRLDRDSKVLWAADVKAHHDLDVAGNGDIYVLSASKLQVRRPGKSIPVLDNHVVILSPQGRVKKRISLFLAFKRSKEVSQLLAKRLAWTFTHFEASLAWYYASTLKHAPEKTVKEMAVQAQAILDNTYQGSERVELMFMNLLQPVNLFHANSILVLPRARKGLWKAGDLLISLREMSIIFIMDPQEGRITWSWGQGELDHQHHPSLLDNGNFLIFDNGSTVKRSRVIEVDPAERRIVWQYQGKPPASFFSDIRGGCQQLPNGNVLITDSERGRVFEVTRAAEVVWEFYNPDLDDPYLARKRAPIYRMTRISEDLAQKMKLGPSKKKPTQQRKKP